METSALKEILYVEDDPDIREIALLALRDVGGFSVKAAGSGQEALSMVRKSLPELILLDVMMPGLDGLATLERLRADPTTAPIPVIFMTAKVHDEDIEHYLNAGAIGVIAKPFDPMILAEHVRDIWAKRVG